MKVSRKIVTYSLTYDYRKLLSHRKIIVRFSCNQAPSLQSLDFLLLLSSIDYMPYY